MCERGIRPLSNCDQNIIHFQDPSLHKYDGVNETPNKENKIFKLWGWLMMFSTDQYSFHIFRNITQQQCSEDEVVVGAVVVDHDSTAVVTVGVGTEVGTAEAEEGEDITTTITDRNHTHLNNKKSHPSRNLPHPNPQNKKLSPIHLNPLLLLLLHLKSI